MITRTSLALGVVGEAGALMVGVVRTGSMTDVPYIRQGYKG